MNKVLHTPGGDIEVKSEEQKAAEADREQMLKSWAMDKEPYQTASIDWTQIQSDELAQEVLDSVADMAASMVLARVMHHGIRTQEAPSAIHITIQVVTEGEDGKLLSFEEITELEAPDGEG